MMSIDAWLLYTAIALANIVSPGPAILLAINNGMTKGQTSVYISSLGNILALLILSGVAMLGLGIILKTSAILFTTIKFIGALYLIYLGIQKFRAKSNFITSDEINAQSSDNYHLFKEGFLVAITNPKPILFFTAIFPLFVNSEQPILPQFAILTATFMAISYLSLLGYGMLSKKIKKWINSENKMIWFNRSIGTLFVAMGAGLLGLRQQTD